MCVICPEFECFLPFGLQMKEDRTTDDMDGEDKLEGNGMESIKIYYLAEMKNS